MISKLRAEAIASRAAGIEAIDDTAL